MASPSIIISVTISNDLSDFDPSNLDGDDCNIYDAFTTVANNHRIDAVGALKGNNFCASHILIRNIKGEPVFCGSVFDLLRESEDDEDGSIIYTISQSLDIEKVFGDELGFEVRDFCENLLSWLNPYDSLEHLEGPKVACVGASMLETKERGICLITRQVALSGPVDDSAPDLAAHIAYLAETSEFDDELSENCDLAVLIQR